jgi:DNA-binding MarR family transcriptional regulator
MKKELNPLFLSQIRLAVVSILIGVESAEFTLLKEETNSTAGNLSFQLSKLEEAGYIKITKSFKNKYPVTKVQMMVKGIKAFEEHVVALRDYINLK